MKNAKFVICLAIAALVIAACSSSPRSLNPPSSADSGPGVNTTFATTAEVLDAVKAAQQLQTLPGDVKPSLQQSDQAGPRGHFDCTEPADNPSGAKVFGNCAYGDPHGTKLMVLYGDSRACMWGSSLAGVAAKNGWKLMDFCLPGCPGPDLHFTSEQTKSPNDACDAFHTSAVTAIRNLHPQLVLVSSSGGANSLTDGNEPTDDQWRDGWISTLAKLSQPGTKVAMIGVLPTWTTNDSRCLAAHSDDIQKCSATLDRAFPSALRRAGEQAAADRAGALYVSPQSWICADTCQPVIASIRVFNDNFHLTQSYADYISGALSDALQPVLQG